MSLGHLVIVCYFSLLFFFSEFSFIHASICQSFQALDYPRPVSLNLCQAYSASACCNSPTAKRAFNWVLEDDGCGIIPPYTACRQLLTQLACAVNCLPDLIVTGVNYQAPPNTTVIPGLPVICSSFADAMYAACATYSWCGIPQQMTSTCEFLAIQTSGKTSSLNQVTAADTCTWVGGPGMSSTAFLQNIIGVRVAVVDGAVNSTIPGVCVYPKPTVAATANMQTQPVFVMVFFAALLSVLLARTTLQHN